MEKVIRLYRTVEKEEGKDHGGVKELANAIGWWEWKIWRKIGETLKGGWEGTGGGND